MRIFLLDSVFSHYYWQWFALWFGGWMASKFFYTTWFLGLFWKSLFYFVPLNQSKRSDPFREKPYKTGCSWAEEVERFPGRGRERYERGPGVLGDRGDVAKDTKWGRSQRLQDQTLTSTLCTRPGLTPKDVISNLKCVFFQVFLFKRFRSQLHSGTWKWCCYQSTRSGLKATLCGLGSSPNLCLNSVLSVSAADRQPVLSDPPKMLIPGPHHWSTGSKSSKAVLGNTHFFYKFPG